MMMAVETLYGLGMILVFTGILITIVAVILLLIYSVRASGKVKGGGVIIVGPFPIVFGTDKESIRTILLLSLVLTVFLVTMVVIFYIMSR